MLDSCLDQRRCASGLSVAGSSAFQDQCMKENRRTGEIGEAIDDSGLT